AETMRRRPPLSEPIRANHDRTVAHNTDLHRTPGRAIQPTPSAAELRARPPARGLATHACGGTGVAAVIEHGKGPVIGYRADIGGLPIAEDTGLDYASTAEGILPGGETTAVMHGCGHDAHITVGLYLAKYLVEHRQLWSGTVVMLFQPGEETGQGARAML